jgi:hypothetical protein
MPRRIAQPNRPRGHVWQAYVRVRVRVRVLGGAARRGAPESSGTPDRRALGAGPVAHHNCPPKTARRTRSAVTGVSAHAAGVARRKGYLGLVTTAAWLPPWKTL